MQIEHRLNKEFKAAKEGQKRQEETAAAEAELLSGHSKAKEEKVDREKERFKMQNHRTLKAGTRW